MQRLSPRRPKGYCESVTGAVCHIFSPAIMRRLTIAKRCFFVGLLLGLLTLLLGLYGSIPIVMQTSSLTQRAQSPTAMHNIADTVVLSFGQGAPRQSNDSHSLVHSAPPHSRYPGTANNISQSLSGGTKYLAQNTTVARDNCWSLLDDVKIGHVTQEGKTFTADQLDTARFKNIVPLIPKIIHQTWDTYDIPRAAVPWVTSLLRHHPDWQYWFWTQNDVKCYLRQHHSEYINLYNSYFSTIFRTDVMRYFLLHDYGGIYLDLDVECLKPLDIWTHLAPAILSHETYEHAFVMHRLSLPNVMTTVLATRPNHPYYKLLQINLQRYHKAKPMDVLHSTGPYYLDDIYKLYLKQRNLSRHEDEILVIHPKYWLPTHDSMNMSHICSCDLLKKGFFVKKTGEKIRKTADVLQLCALARRKNFVNVPDVQSYLDHHWIHTNLQGSLFKQKDTVSMFSIFPGLVPVSKRLGLRC